MACLSARSIARGRIGSTQPLVTKWRSGTVWPKRDIYPFKKWLYPNSVQCVRAAKSIAIKATTTMNTRIARERCLLFGFWAFFIAVLGWSFYSIGGDELMAYDDALPGLGTIVTAIRGLIAEAPTAEQRVAILQSGRLLAIAGDGWNFAP